VFLFNEQLNISGIIGILLVVTGIVVLNLYGTSN
jgi:multidrug transporter EmrE-like cation transporter